MKKLALCMILSLGTTLTFGQRPAAWQEFDHSNEIDLPNCTLEVTLKVVRPVNGSSQASSDATDVRRISKFEIVKNGKHRIQLTNQFVRALLVDANRIRRPFRDVGCGFTVDTGDNAETGHLLFTVSGNRIASIEQWDAFGRRLSRTVFFEQKPLVIN